MLITYVHGCRQYSLKQNEKFVYVYNPDLTINSCESVGIITDLSSKEKWQCTVEKGDLNAFHKKWAVLTNSLTETSCGGILVPIKGSPGLYEIANTF
ncbi:hypothetical protein SeLEV6574_g07909 [Synchytrium endobioticum]|uniref:Uncharacterized protein n=1 Tax=Synchytrium endobioticum TaxID=286115 RepID=A0A507CI54_9FUNG|nr:hypothetical protein SeLEV6574_g07909 [Synchytrium endobioticum]